MRLASVLTPLNETNLTLAAQCGVEDITVRYPGPDLARLGELKCQIEAHGLRLGNLGLDLLKREMARFGA